MESPGSAPSTKRGPVSGSAPSRLRFSSVSPGSNVWSPKAFFVSTRIRLARGDGRAGRVLREYEKTRSERGIRRTVGDPKSYLTWQSNDPL